MYDADELLQEFPSRPISSLRDIQYVYGRLYTLATVGGGEYGAYLTPAQADELVGEPDSLIVVRADLSGDEPRLDSDEPVWVRNYQSDIVADVAHSYYDSARGFDHSITHRSGRDKEPEKLAEYAQERLTRWATDDVIQAAGEDHEDGWIIDALAEMGEDEDVLGKIEEEVTRLIDGTATSLLTVQVKLEEDGDYLYPGDVEVFNEAMKQRILSKLVSKGDADESEGEAVDLVTGDEAVTVGTSEDPLNYYLGKQMEKFPGFDADEAWRSHPVSQDTAVDVDNAGPFVEACTYTTFGATVYYLPYFIGEPEVDSLLTLYGLLYGVLDEENMTTLEFIYREYDGDVEKIPGRLRFYVSAVRKHQQKRFDVYGETMDGRIHHPIELEGSHNQVLKSWVFDDEGTDGRASAALGVPPESDNSEEDHWQLLRKDRMKVDIISTGWYFALTFPRPDDEQTFSADDARVRALVSVLSGEGIDVGELLKLYSDRLTEESGDSFPRHTVASQYAQMCALADAGLLKTKEADREPLTKPNEYTEGYMTTNQAIADGGSKAAVRERKIAQFIEQTPALEDTERRGAFLLGALVGHMSGIQSAEGRSTTLVDQYPVKSMTRPKIKRTTEEVIDKDLVYSREKNLSSTMFAEVVDRLRDTLLEKDVETWDIRTEDLRFYYSLGVTYGLNSYVSAEEQDSQEN